MKQGAVNLTAPCSFLLYLYSIPLVEAICKTKFHPQLEFTFTNSFRRLTKVAALVSCLFLCYNDIYNNAIHVYENVLETSQSGTFPFQSIVLRHGISHISGRNLRVMILLMSVHTVPCLRRGSPNFHTNLAHACKGNVPIPQFNRISVEVYSIRVNRNICSVRM